MTRLDGNFYSLDDFAQLQHIVGLEPGGIRKVFGALLIDLPIERLVLFEHGLIRVGYAAACAAPVDIAFNDQQPDILLQIKLKLKENLLPVRLHGLARITIRKRNGSSQSSGKSQQYNGGFLFHFLFLHVIAMPITAAKNTTGASRTNTYSKPCSMVPAAASSGLL